jgi:cytochrome c oxidase subunit 2
MNIPFMPPEASTSAQQIDYIFLGLLVLTAFFVALVFTIVIVAAFRFRRRHPAEFGRKSTGSSAAEWGGVAFLGLLSMGMFFWAGTTYIHLFNPPANAETVFITGKQWMWKAQHMTGQREINTLHLVVGQPVKLIMTSEDVIHDFYVPAFRMHTDVLPGRYSTEWFTPTETGTFHLFCSQYCGTGHSLMVGEVIVMNAADYQAWLAGGPQQSVAQEGARLFQDSGCDACHRPDSLARAPNLVGLFGNPVRLSNGQVVTADDNYIRQSILSPASQVVAGFQPIMPSFQGMLNEEQVFALVAYIQSLGTPPGSPSAAGTTQPFLPSAGSPPPGLPPILPIEGGTPVATAAVALPTGTVAPTNTPSSPSAGATVPVSTQQPLGGTPGPGAASSAAGQQLFEQKGCSGCHLVDGSGPAPSLVGVYGHPVPLQSGQTVTADTAYIRESILDPTAKVVKGYQPIMPSFSGQLTDAQINQLIAYIQSLSK